MNFIKKMFKQTMKLLKRKIKDSRNRFGNTIPFYIYIYPKEHITIPHLYDHFHIIFSKKIHLSLYYFGNQLSSKYDLNFNTKL